MTRESALRVMASTRQTIVRGIRRALAGEAVLPTDGSGARIHESLTPTAMHSIYRRRLLARQIAQHFNRVYYYAPERTVYNTRWLGHTVVKYPTDLWVYQELLSEQRPDLIVETGTYLGGSALFLAGVCDLIGHGRVLSIDVESGAYGELPQHPRITYLKGSSVASETLVRVRSAARDSERVMVILDSLHTREHVLNELRAYAPLIPVGGYLVVEDTNINNHPVLPDWGPGPMEAVTEFLAGYPGFVSDTEREKFMLSANPRGFLRRAL